MRCPNCGEQYASFETRCSRCDRELVADDVGERGGSNPDTRAVSVFKSDDPAILPLATMALDAEGIEYLVHHAGKYDSLEWTRSQAPTNRAVVMEILVGSDVAAKARDLLVDLEQASGLPSTLGPTGALTAESVIPEPPSVALMDVSSGTVLGNITESQLQEITSRLEEETSQQYFVTAATVEMLEQEGVDSQLVTLLRHAVGTGDGRSIRWTVG